MNKKTIVIVCAAVAVAAGGAYWYLNSRDQESTSPSGSGSNTSGGSGTSTQPGTVSKPAPRLVITAEEAKAMGPDGVNAAIKKALQDFVQEKREKKGVFGGISLVS